MTQPEITVSVKLTPFMLDSPQQMLNALIGLQAFGYWGSVRYSNQITGGQNWDMELNREGQQPLDCRIGQVIIKYSNSPTVEVLSAEDYVGKYGE